MLDNLVQTIETLKQRIRDHGNDIADYESRTRVTLIDPMLCALGWDVSDPSVVQIEPKVENGWADYALLGGNGRAVVFVEAKKLSHKESPIGQIIRYAGEENYRNQANITYCVYTNGDTWEVVNVREQQPVMAVSIFKDDAAKCALRFLSLWRRSMADGIFDTAVEPVVGVDPSESVSAPNSGSVELVPDCKVRVKQSSKAKSFRGKEGRLIMLGEGTGALVQVDNIKKWFSRHNLEVLLA